MSKKYHVDLTDSERLELTKIVKRRKANSQISIRSKILLAADRLGDKSWKDKEIALKYEVSIRRIERLRKCFVEDGLLIALNGKPRLNLDKVKFDGEVESKLVALRCSQPQEGSLSWTLKLLADKMVELSYVESISQESVRQILKKTKLSLGK